MVQKMKYFVNRQNPLEEIPEEELDELFGEVINSFDGLWLKALGDNPLQKLWSRKDSLATNEIFSLAVAIKKLKSIDKNWLENQIKFAKGKNKNNRKGAFWEILGLSYLHTGNLAIQPTTASFPGIDGILYFPNGARINLSCKNYGLSTHHDLFQDKCKDVEKLILDILKKTHIHSLQLIILSNYYPQDSDWTVLRKELKELINRNRNTPGLYHIGKCWTASITSLSDEDNTLHKGMSSYQLNIMSPYHKNEEKNLLSKLDDACANLSKHSPAPNSQSINAVYIHLPETASVKKCAEWATEYLNNFPEKPIETVLLYQPTVVINPEENSTGINHCFQFALNQKFMNWRINNNQLINFDIPVGSVSIEPSFYQLLMGNKEIILDEHYTFQVGNIYRKAIQSKDGSISGDVRKLASGVFEHSIISLFNKEILVKGHFSPKDELLIL